MPRTYLAAVAAVLLLIIVSPTVTADAPSGCVITSRIDGSSIVLGAESGDFAIIYTNATFHLSSRSAEPYSIVVDSVRYATGTVNGSVDVPLNMKPTAQTSRVLVSIGERDFSFSLRVINQTYERVIEEQISRTGYQNLGDLTALVMRHIATAVVIVLLVLWAVVPYAKRRQVEIGREPLC